MIQTPYGGARPVGPQAPRLRRPGPIGPGQPRGPVGPGRPMQPMPIGPYGGGSPIGPYPNMPPPGAMPIGPGPFSGPPAGGMPIGPGGYSPFPQGPIGTNPSFVGGGIGGAVTGGGGDLFQMPPGFDPDSYQPRMPTLPWQGPQGPGAGNDIVTQVLFRRLLGTLGALPGMQMPNPGTFY